MLRFECVLNLKWQSRPSLRHHTISARNCSCTALITFFFCILFVCPAFAATWTVRSQPPRLVNGAPVLFQVKPPAKLDSLTGTWLTHQLTFSYDAPSKTWFALAGVNFDTTPGNYALELTGQPATGKTPLTFTRTFAVAHFQYPQIKVE